MPGAHSELFWPKSHHFSFHPSEGGTHFRGLTQGAEGPKKSFPPWGAVTRFSGLQEHSGLSLRQPISSRLKKQMDANAELAMSNDHLGSKWGPWSRVKRDRQWRNENC